jgi:hypothetical protein
MLPVIGLKFTTFATELENVTPLAFFKPEQTLSPENVVG